MSHRHALEPALTRAGNAADAMRSLMLAEVEPGERALIDGTLAELAVRLRATPFRSEAARRAARRLAAAVGSESGP